MARLVPVRVALPTRVRCRPRPGVHAPGWRCRAQRISTTVHGVTASLPAVRLVPVDATNWRAVAAVSPREDQQRYVTAVTYYLCLALYDGTWHCLAVVVGGAVVGHVMWGVDPQDGAVWLGGLVVDSSAQGRGVGRAAVAALLDRFTTDGRVNVALSYAPDNTVARNLYRTLGFVETGEMEDDEVVARYRRDGDAASIGQVSRR